MTQTEAVMVMGNGREVSGREERSDLQGNGTRGMGTETQRMIRMEQGR